MRIEYERACVEAGTPEETVKAIRKMFDGEKKRLKREKNALREAEFFYYSIELLKDPDDGCYYDIPDPEMNTEEIILHKLDLERLSVILDMLPEMDKQFILDCFEAEYGTQKDLAQKYGITVGAVVQKKWRILKKLRELFFSNEN